MSLRRWSLRWRLTRLLAGLVLLVGLGVLGAGWFELDRSITEQSIDMPPVLMPGDPGSSAATDPAGQKAQAVAAEAKVRNGFRERTLGPVIRREALALAGLGVVAAAVGGLAVGRSLRPIHQITATARRVADLNLRERIELAGPPDELRELSDTFDQMLARLDSAFDGQRQFVANASHELKTPLAINRTLLEVALGRPSVSPDLRVLAETLLEVNVRQERLIEGLLTLTRSAQAVAEPTEFDLTEITAALVDEAGAEAERFGVRLELEPARLPALLRADPLLIEHLIRNLLQNAVRHNTRDGCVWIRLAPAPGEVRLTVSNTGPSVPAAVVPRLFEPFRRLTDRTGSTPGTGLGLAIAMAVARAHAGTLEATPRAGGGLEVVLRLPAA